MSVTVTKSAWSKLSKILNINKSKYGILLSSYDTSYKDFVYSLSIIDENKHKKLLKENKKLNIICDPNTFIKLYIDPEYNKYIKDLSIDYVEI